MIEFKFDVGDRVKRPVDVYAPMERWYYKYGMIVRRYSAGRNPEVYDIWWDNKDQPDKGYLPHGLEPAGYEKKEVK
jgi:hypothetical protein